MISVSLGLRLVYASSESSTMATLEKNKRKSVIIYKMWIKSYDSKTT